MENKANRREERRLRKEVRQAAKSGRVATRQETKQTAYENGFDPNQWIADSVGHAADAVGAVYGGKFGKGDGAEAMEDGGGSVSVSQGGLSPIMMGAIGLGAFLMLKK